MVKEQKSKKPKGEDFALDDIILKKSKRPRSPMTETKRGTSELIILSHLKKRKFASPTTLTTVTHLNGADCDNVCRVLTKNKLIKLEKLSASRRIYVITEKGKKSLDFLLSLNKDPDNPVHALTWMALFKKIHTSKAYPDVTL
tara:strand:+ start:87 stop:515 length:429 start_codon:yes stop_codon:yes gene_type:complete